jgi:hypothetical protein
MVDSIFKKMGSVVATAVANEASARQAAVTTLTTALETANTNRQNAISTEASARQAADTTLTNNLASEATSRATADNNLTTAINTEKARIDAILSASSADKDSFAEIVTLINSVDTTNDNAFASYVTSNNAAVAALDTAYKAADTTLTNNLALKAPIANPTFTGVATFVGIKETKIAMSANNIDLATGSVFSKTISGATTLTISNSPTSGLVGTFILNLTNGGSSTITWFSGIKWVGGTAPTLTTAGRDRLGFITEDGGTTWDGFVMGKDLK